MQSRPGSGSRRWVRVRKALRCCTSRSASTARRATRFRSCRRDHRTSLARTLLHVARAVALPISSCALHYRVSNIRAQCRRLATHAGLPVEDAGAEGDSRKQREEEQKQNNKNIASCEALF